MAGESGTKVEGLVKLYAMVVKIMVFGVCNRHYEKIDLLRRERSPSVKKMNRSLEGMSFQGEFPKGSPSDSPTRDPIPIQFL